jgi:hypothetical protein
VYEYFGLKPKTQKFIEIPKKSFNGQLNMFFGKNISCTCDLHLKVDIEPIEHNFLSNGKKKFLFLVALSFKS